MTRTPTRLFAGGIAGLLPVTAAALWVALPAQAAPPKLTGVVGPGFDITLKKSGKTVKALKAGAYSLSVTDRSSIHNFRLSGPGVKFDSGIGRRSTRTVTVTLKKGTYKFLCDPHTLVMSGSFKVG